MFRAGQIGLVVSFVLLLSANSQAGQILYGITADDHLITINTSTGAGTDVGLITLAGVPISIASPGLASLGGNLYAYDSNKNLLRQIDPSSAAIVSTVNLGVTTIIGEGDLTFRGDGTGFMTSTLQSNGTFGAGSLLMFTTTANSSAVVNTSGLAGGFGSYDGLAFQGNTLYALAQSGNALYTINTTSGSPSAIGSTGLTTVDPVTGYLIYGFGGLAFGPNDGVLYAELANFDGTSNLYTLNTGTGAATLVGAIGVDNVDGLAFLSAPLVSIAVTPASPSIQTGQMQQFTATGTYSDGTKSDITSQVTWNSATMSVATINSSGLATAVNGGTSNITASLNGITSPPVTLTVTAPPSITQNPMSVTVNAGQMASFTAAATGNPAPTVQWQISTDGGMTFSNIQNATSTTYSFTTASTDNGHQFRAVFTNAIGSATTTAAALTVDFAPSVTQNPISQTVNAGQLASFNAAATGNPTPTVQWQISTDGGMTYSNIAGATSTTYSFTTASTDNTHQFRAVFTNAVGSATTTAATLTVDFVPSVTQNPMSVTVNAGQLASFAAAASGNPAPTVQWQISTDGGMTFTNIQNATSTTYSFTTASTDNGHQFRAVFTNAIGSATTTAAVLTVDFAPSVTQSPASQTVNAGLMASFTAAASGNPAPTVQWQVSTDGGVTYSNIPGATSTTYSFITAFANNGSLYRAVFTNAVGSATTNTALLTIDVAPVVTQNPVSVTVSVGQTASFNAAASGNPAPTVQWQVSTNGGMTFTNIPGATSTTWSFTALLADNGQQFRAVFTNAVTSVTTTVATLTVTTNFVTGYALNSPGLRNNLSGFAGLGFTVGANALMVNSLGRVCVAGNSAVHTVKLVSASSMTDLPGGSTTVNMGGCIAGQFVYSNLASPVTLLAGTTYYLVSQETYGGDLWYDQGTITTTNGAVVVSSAYLNGSTWATPGPSNTSFVPPDMIYAVVVPSPPPAFVLNYNLNNQPLRNNLTTFAGTSLTVGPTPLMVTNVGRVCVTGNSQSHIVKFVNPATGMDIPGGSATVSMGGCIGSEFVYAPLSGGPLTLQANTAYYLVSQETSGGDQWYDQGTLTTAPYATVGTSVYWSGASWITGEAGTSFVPPNFQYMNVSSGGGGLLTGFALNSPELRNTFSGFVGMAIAVGANPLSASAVGRVCVEGNSQTHTVKIVSALTGADLPGGAASVNMAGCTPGKIVYANLGSPITLLPGGTYYVVSQETNGGDLWYDLGQVSARTDASITGAVYQNGASYIANTNANTAYVPPDFQYTVLPPAPQPLVTAFNLNNPSLRNNFTGLVGMAFTVGPNSLTVTSLGRLCAAGNSQMHTIELINVAAGTVVPGSSAILNMTGCAPGGFAYAILGAPVTLNAATSYYLVSQETSGGDQWYDLGALQTTTAAQVSNSVYQFNGTWTATGGPDTSYVPVNLLYELVP